MVMRADVRLRTLMGLVAVVGLLTAWAIGMATERRRAVYRDRTDTFALGEADVLEQIVSKLTLAREAESRGGPDAQGRAAELRADAEAMARLAAWHVKMERKYAHAAAHPWEALPPDDSPP